MLHKFNRTDANDKEIVEVLNKLGWEVIDYSQAGQGKPDKAIWHQGRQQLHLVEIKNGKLGWKWTEAQKKFRKRYTVPILVFDSVESVLKWEKASRGSKQNA